MIRIKFTTPAETAEKLRTSSLSMSPDLSSVPRIIEDVKRRGDKALRYWSKKLDSVSPQDFRVSDEKIEQARANLQRESLDALLTSAKTIRKCAEEIMHNIRETSFSLDGLDVFVDFSPVESVLCYAPGGNFSLPSSLLMSAVTAQVAGVKNIYASSPNPSEALLAAASIAGVKNLYRLGGAQALAAFAFSTESIPKVDMIVGAGGAYVTEAKRLLFGQVGIDLIAGPTELLVIADRSGNARIIALDLLSQAEHSHDSFSAFVSPEPGLLSAVRREIAALLDTAKIPRWLSEKAKKIPAVCTSLEQAVELANALAPEHIQLMLKRPEKFAKRLTHYGALFVGRENGTVFGDYCAGTNHILPTSSAARFSSALSPLTFLRLRYRTIQKKTISPKLIQCASKLAETEGLKFHSLAASSRFRI
ncbi:MAG: histidinol dehydrogenase [Planctomycetota bacterium]|nr:histidinol dehydrogenase [Planctomycetota bacterium]